MSLMPTAPRSIGGVLDDAIRLYRATLFPCFPLLLIGVVLTTASGVWVLVNIQPVTATADPSLMLARFMNPAVWLGYLAMLAIITVIYGALIHQINALAHGQRPTLGEAVGVSLKRLPTLIGVSVLVGLMVVVGLVVLVIPGIWLWGVFQLSWVAAVVDRTSVRGSLGASRGLVRGNWWRTNVVMFVALVIMVVLGMVAGIIAGIAIVASDGVAATQSLEAQVVQQVISGVLNLFTLSFYLCVMLAVYNDLKLRRDGADLADRVGALTPAG